MTGQIPPGTDRDTCARCSRVGTETILLVDDDKTVRTLARMMLRRAGFSVLEAGDGLEALRIVTEHAGPIHLLISDLSMPRMDGMRLARAVDELHPGMRVLYVSGYANGDTGDEALPPGADFVEKPFSSDTLAHKVREILDRPA